MLDETEKKMPLEIIHSIENLAKYEKDIDIKNQLKAIAKDLNKNKEEFYHDDLDKRQDALKSVKDCIEDIIGEELPFMTHLISNDDLHLNHLTDKEKQEVRVLLNLYNILKTIDNIEAEKPEVMIEEIDDAINQETNPEIKDDLIHLKDEMIQHKGDLAENDDARHHIEDDIMDIFNKMTPQDQSKWKKDDIVNMDIEHNPEIMNNLSPAQVNELMDLQNVLKSMRTIDHKKEASMDYMIEQIVKLIKSENDLDLVQDYKRIHALLNEHYDDLQNNATARHKLESMMSDTTADLMGYRLSKEDILDHDFDKMQGTTKRQKQVLKCLQNIMQNMSEMDDKQESDPVFIARSARDMIKNDTQHENDA